MCILKFWDLDTHFECYQSIEWVSLSQIFHNSSSYILLLSRQKSLFFYSFFFAPPPVYISHSLSLVLSLLLLLGWSGRDNGRLIITMKLSWFSALLGAVGRAAAAPKIGPSASPLIIQKHKFSRSLPRWPWAAVQNVCICMRCLMYMWLSEKERQWRQSEEKTHFQHLCVYQNVGACLSQCVCSLLDSVWWCFCFLSRCWAHN